MFVWVENTALALWVSTSLWAYPLLLSLHIVGLAIVAGIFSMRDMHLIGVLNALQVSQFNDLTKLAYLGFTINAISGFLLFTSQASIFITSIPFLSKISLISIAMVLTLFINKVIKRDGNNTRLKIPAFISLLCWINAIVAGRLIAYIF